MWRQDTTTILQQELSFFKSAVGSTWEHGIEGWWLLPVSVLFGRETGLCSPFPCCNPDPGNATTVYLNQDNPCNKMAA